MRIYTSGQPKWMHFLTNSLKIDTYCALCGRRGTPQRDLCSACESLLVPRYCNHPDGQATFLCLLCGQPVQVDTDHTEVLLNRCCPQSPGGPSTQYCEVCHANSSPFLRVLAPYRYTFPIDHVIRRLKYGNRRQLARVLGSLLAQAAKAEASLPDVLMPVPLFAGRQRRRGYNQAADIARWCGAELGIATRSDWVARIEDTGSLAGLSRAEREHRIIGAFRACEAVRGQRLALVDDVLTTGSTARELARELYDSGARSVELWVLARTSSDR